jgi:hypothetical protein
MKKKILLLSISAIVLLVGASFTTAIGTNHEQSTKTYDSPLFSVRTQRSVQSESKHLLQSHFLGKGIQTNLFTSSKPSLASAIDRTVKLLQQNPVFFVKFLDAISQNPRVIALLQQNGIGIDEFTTHLNRLKKDPSVFIDEIRSAEPKLSAEKITTPLPLGLNTSSVIGCLVTAIALVPIALIISLIVVFFTIRIIQCLNIDSVMNQIMNQLIQELFPPGNTQ